MPIFIVLVFIVLVFMVLVFMDKFSMALPSAGAMLSMPVGNYAIVLHGAWRCPETLNMSGTAAVFT
jgi:hypothetical protein